MFQGLNNSHNDSDRDDESAAAVEIVLVQLCEEEKQPERNKKRMLPCGAATKRRRQYHSLTVCIAQRRDYKKYPALHAGTCAGSSGALLCRLNAQLYEPKLSFKERLASRQRQ